MGGRSFTIEKLTDFNSRSSAWHWWLTPNRQDGLCEREHWELLFSDFGATFLDTGQQFTFGVFKMQLLLLLSATTSQMLNWLGYEDESPPLSHKTMNLCKTACRLKCNSRRHSLSISPQPKLIIVKVSRVDS